MKHLFLLVSFLCLMVGNSGLEAKEISKETIQKVAIELASQHPACNQALMQRGISQVASLWQEQDGNDEVFAKFIITVTPASFRAASAMAFRLSAGLMGEEVRYKRPSARSPKGMFRKFAKASSLRCA